MQRSGKEAQASIILAPMVWHLTIMHLRILAQIVLHLTIPALT